MRWVVDASIAAKWLAPEAESAQAETLLEGELITPDLIFPEMANILWKKQLRGEMDAAVRWLTQVPLQVIESASLMIDALALALRLQHPAYDCFYLALARQAGSALVTADKRLVERCQCTDARDLNVAVISLDTTGSAP